MSRLIIRILRNYGDTHEVLTNRMLKEAREAEVEVAFSCPSPMSQQHYLHLLSHGFFRDNIDQGSQLLDVVSSELFSSAAMKVHGFPPHSMQTYAQDTHPSFLPQHCHNRRLVAPQ